MRVPAEPKEQGDLEAGAGRLHTGAGGAAPSGRVAVVHIHEPRAIRQRAREENAEPKDPTAVESNPFTEWKKSARACRFMRKNGHFDEHRFVEYSVR